MILSKIVDLRTCRDPLTLTDVPRPVIEANEVLIQVSVCGVCHTEIDEIEGRTPPPKLPVILGHQVVGTVAQTGENANRWREGSRIGVAWIFSACGNCEFCLSNRENLCQDFLATGRDVNGGYAEYMRVPEAYTYAIPESLSDAEAAPLLCAGAIGFRSLRLSGIENGNTLGLTGFGASAHLVLKMVRHRYPDSEIYVFARSRDERKFALSLGAVWAGDTGEEAPEKLNAIIDTTPVWKPVVEALRQLKPGGRLVINAIRKEGLDQDYLLQLDYPQHLWMEKEVKSVANVERKDVQDFLDLAGEAPIIPEYMEYPLEQANLALRELKQGKIKGAKVLRIR